MTTVNLGGGYKVARVAGEDATDLVLAGTPVASALEDFAHRCGRQLRLEIEPGTFLVANAGAILSTVIDVVDTGSNGYNFIKVDAGMGRLGIELGEAEKFIREVSTFNNIKIEGVYTHLSFKDSKGQEWSKRGIERFNRLNDRLRDGGLDIPVTQAVASANLMVGHMDGSNAICPGALLYGLSAVNPDLASIKSFRPVLTAIKARLIHVGAFPDDLALKEGGYHTMRQSDRTGVVPLGLYDGYRKAQGGTPSVVLINGKRRPVLGISLEHLTFDLLGDETVQVGDTVTVLGADSGDEITIAEMASWQGMGLNDLLMNFDGRLPGRYRGG